MRRTKTIPPVAYITGLTLMVLTTGAAVSAMPEASGVVAAGVGVGVGVWVILLLTIAYHLFGL